METGLVMWWSLLTYITLHATHSFLNCIQSFLHHTFMTFHHIKDLQFTLCFCSGQYLWFTFIVCLHTYLHFTCKAILHTQCKLHSNVSFSTTICLYGISYNFHWCGKLAHKFYTHVKYFGFHAATISNLIHCFVFQHGKTYALFCAKHTHIHFPLALLAHILYIYNVKIVIALSTQLVRFLRGASLSEVVFASKSSLSLRFIETYPNVLGAHPLLVVFNFYTNTHPLYVIVHTRTFLHTHTHTLHLTHISSIHTLHTHISYMLCRVCYVGHHSL